MEDRDTKFEPFSGMWAYPYTLPFGDSTSAQTTDGSAYTGGPPDLKSPNAKPLFTSRHQVQAWVSLSLPFLTSPRIHISFASSSRVKTRTHAQDWGSCLVGFQTQVRGTKRWRIQTPFTATQLGAAPFDFQSAAQHT